MTGAEAVADWLPPRPLCRSDLADLEALDAVTRAVTVRLVEEGDATLAGGLQVEVEGGLVYLADLQSGTWRLERYTGANVWWLRDDREERVDVRD